MNSSQKYKLETTEIAAFVIGVFVLMGVNRFVFALGAVVTEPVKTSVQIMIVAFVASLFGGIIGCLTGALGIICSLAVCGQPIVFSNAVAFAVYGALVGQFANQYFIREGAFKIRQIVLWNATNIFSLILAFNMVKPFIDFIVYRIELIGNLEISFIIVLISMLIVGAILTACFYFISCIFARVKK